ncbi:MAG: DNA recombination/repair protein RecA, partial [Synergistaceae bacterium]|nr:DNA recombination/repair protein RecA [Synergistaceae bacterium]
ETIGQGKESVAQFLEKTPDLEKEIIAEIMAVVGKGIGYMPAEHAEPSEGEDEPDRLVEEGGLDLSEDESGPAAAK